MLAEDRQNLERKKSMKKKVVALLLVAMMAVTATGCGNKGTTDNVRGTEAVEATESTTDVTYETPSFDVNPSDYVTLCDYSNIEVNITGDYTVDDAKVKDYFSQIFTNYGPFYTADDTKTTVEEGDIVNVDYVGKLDGEAFDGGSAENQNIDVYNNSAAGGGSGYIDGFTDGLKGAKVGDVIDCNVTFPEDYTAENLAGKEVVFTFTVNSIQKEMALDDVDDNFAKEQFNVDTVDEMYDQIASMLKSSAESTKMSDTYSAIQDYLLENCKVEVPEDYLSARVNDYEKQFVQSKLSGNADGLEDYLSSNYNMTLDEARNEWTEGMKKNIQMEFIMQTIAEKENLSLDEDGYNTYIQNMISNNGFDSEEALYQNYGYNDPAFGEKYLKQIYVDNLALDQIRENAVVNETAAESTEAVTETETEE